MLRKITKKHTALLALTALAVVFCVFYASLYFADTAVPADIYNFRVERGEFKASETPVLDIGLSGKESGFAGSLPGLKPKLQKVTLVGPNGEERVIKEEGDLRMVKGQIKQIEVERGASFRPGKYKAILEFEKGSGTYTLEQDFTWGVLALNFNKSIYSVNTNEQRTGNNEQSEEPLPTTNYLLPTNESDTRAFIQMGVLDDAGHTICDASLKLEIRNPKSETQILTTEDGSIQRSETCAGDSVNPEPDYSVYYSFPTVINSEQGTESSEQYAETGTYEVELTATTENGTQTTSDSFEVKELTFSQSTIDNGQSTGDEVASIPFDVERTGPTRIYPVEPYDMSFTITANQDFSGDITETVPSSFQIIGSNLRYGVHDIHADALRDKTKKIIWKDIELQAGESIEINYTFDAPDKSPQFYLLGPLQFNSSNKSNTTNSSNLVFEEQRQWQIASDATLPTIYVNSTQGDGDDSVSVVDELANTCDTVNCSTSVDISGGDDDSTYVVNNDFNTGTVTQGFQLDDMPGDFQNMDSATATFRLQDVNSTNDNESVTLQAQIVEADGSTALTGLDTVHTHNGTTSFTEFTISFSSLNTTANASVWNGAELELTWDYVKDKGPEDLQINVSGVEIEGEYTQVPPGFDVSGVLREADGSAVYDCSSAAVTLQLREDGAGTDSTVCNASSGAYTFTGLSASANTLVSVWASDNTFSTAFSSDGSAVSGVDLYQNTVILRDDDNSDIATADLANCDATACAAGVGFEEATGDLTVSDGWGLHIWTGDTFTPGGTVTTSPSGDSSTADGDIEIASSATLDMASNNLSVGGDFTNDGTYSKTAPQLTTFSATATSQAITTGASNFDDVEFNGSGGEWSFGEADTIEGDLTMTAGTLSGTNNLTVNGDATGTSGVINLTGGLFEQRVSAASTFATSSGTANWTFSNLTFSNSTGGALTVAAHNGGTGTIEVAEALTIGLGGDSAGTTLDAGDRSWILSDSDGCPCTPFVIDGTNGTFTANTSTFDYTGAGATNITATTYNILEITPAATVTHTLGTAGSQSITVNSGLTVGDGTNEVTVTAETWDPDLTVTNNSSISANATFTAGAGTHHFSAGLLTINGTLNGSDAGTIIAKNDVAGGGLVNLTGGTFKHEVASARNFGSSGGSSDWTFNNLTFDNAAATASDVTWNSGGTGEINVSGNFLVSTTGTGAFTVNNEGNDRILDIEGNFTLNGSTTFQASSTAAFNVAGSWTNNGTFTAGSGTVTFDDTAGSKTLSGTMTGTSAFNNVVFNGSGGGWSLNAAALVEGDLTMSAGTLSGTNNLTVNGDATGTSGIINLTGGTFEQRVSAASTFATSSGTANWTFNNLTFSNSTGGALTVAAHSGGTGTIEVAGDLNIGLGGDSAGTTLDAGDRSWILSNTGAPLVVDGTNGTFTANTSTFTYTGAGATTPLATTYHNFEASSSATATFTPEAGTYTVNNDFTVGDGTNPTVFAADTNDPTLDVTGTVTIAANSQLEASATGSFTVAGGWTNNGTFIHNEGTVVFDDDDSDGPETLSGNLETANNGSFNSINFNSSTGSWIISNNFESEASASATSDFLLTAGTLEQGDNINLLITNETVTISDGAVFTKAGGTGLFILDGIEDNQEFTDASSGTKQDLGDVHIGQSPGVTNLKSDFAATSLTVNSGDTFNTRGWEVDITESVTVNGTLDASNGGCGSCDADGSVITVGTDWTVASAATWIADEGANFTTVTFDESTAGTITTGGTDQYHDFYRVNISKTAAATVDMATDNIVINENFSITNSNSTFDVTATGCSGSVSCDMTVGGDWTNNSSGIFNEQTGLVTLTGGSAASATHTTDEGGAFHDLTLDDSADSDTFLLGSALDVDGDLTITGGTLDTDSTGNYAVNIAGNYTNNDTFTANQSTVTIDGANQQTLDGTLTGSSAFYDLTFTNTSGTDASDDERTDFVPGVIFNTDASATSTFAITTGAVRVEYSSGNTYTFNNINWDGQGTEIYFRNSTTSGDWKLDVTCTSCPVSYVNVSRSDADGGSTIDATDGTNYDGGNNINWDFPVAITISGTYFDTAESAAQTAASGVDMKLVNSASAATSYDTTIDASGNFSFSVSATPTSGDDLVMWLDNDATFKGTLVLEYGASCTGHTDCTGLSVYQDRVGIQSHDDDAMANADLANCDNDTGAACSDTDIGYTSNTGDLTVSDGRELHIYSGDTFTPGGTVTTSPSSDASSADGDVHIATGATFATEGNDVTVGGDFTNEGSYTRTGTQDTRFNATTSGHTIDIGANSFSRVFFSGGGGWSPVNNTLSGSVLAMGSGTFGDSNGTANVEFTSDINCDSFTSSCGVINFTSASHTFTQSVNANSTFGTDIAEADVWTFNNLIFEGTAGNDTITINSAGTGDIVVNNNLIINDTGAPTITIDNHNDTGEGDRVFDVNGDFIIDASETFQASSATPLELAGNFTNNGTFTANSGEVIFDDNSKTTTFTGDTTFFSFTSTTVSKDLTFSANSTTSIADSGAITLNGSDCSTQIQLRSSEGGTDWLLDIGTGVTQDMQFIDVADSNATSTGATATNSTDSGHNTNWSIDDTCFDDVFITPGTYNNLEVYPASSTTRHIFGTAASQSITTDGYLKVGDGTGTGLGDAFFYNPGLDVGTNFTISSNANFSAPYSSSFSIAANWTSNGTFINNQGEVAFDDANQQSIIAGATRFFDFLSTAAGNTLLFTAGETFGIDGLFTLTGASGNEIIINSTDDDGTPTQWLVDHQGTEDTSFANIKNSGCDPDSTDIDVFTSDGNIDSGNNDDCWIFEAGFTITGTLHQEDESTPYDCSADGGDNDVDLKLSVEGSAASTAICNASSGAYTFTNVSAAANSTITIWADGNTTFTGSLAYSTDGSAISNADLYQDRVILRDDDNANIATTDLASCDSNSGTGCSDTDIGFTADSGNLTVLDGYELHIWTGDTYTPGGTVTTSPSADGTDTNADGDVHIASSATLDIGTNNLSIGGDFDNDGTFSKTAPQLTTFTATATGHDIHTGTDNFDDLTFDGASGGWSFTDTDDTVEGNFTITDGAVTAPSGTLTVNGDFNDNNTAGGFTHNSGTVAFGSGTHNIGGATTAGGDFVTFNNFTAQSAGSTLVFEEPGANTGEIRIEGKFTVEGEDGNDIHIHSSAGGTQWLIDHQGTESVQYAHIQDSGCATGTTNVSLDSTSTNDSNNDESCWLFPAASFTLDSTSINLDMNDSNTFTASASNTLTVQSQSENGFDLFAYQTQPLTHTQTADTIDDWTGTYSSPTTWTGNCINDGECGWGYNTDDADIGFGSAYAAFSTTAPGDSVSESTTDTDLTDDVVIISYKTSVLSSQPAGEYQTTIIYILTPTF